MRLFSRKCAANAQFEPPDVRGSDALGAKGCSTGKTASPARDGDSLPTAASLPGRSELCGDSWGGRRPDRDVRPGPRGNTINIRQSLIGSLLSKMGVTCLAPPGSYLSTTHPPIHAATFIFVHPSLAHPSSIPPSTYWADQKVRVGFSCKIRDTIT